MSFPPTLSCLADSTCHNPPPHFSQRCNCNGGLPLSVQTAAGVSAAEHIVQAAGRNDACWPSCAGTSSSKRGARDSGWGGPLTLDKQNLLWSQGTLHEYGTMGDDKGEDEADAVRLPWALEASGLSVRDLGLEMFAAAARSGERRACGTLVVCNLLSVARDA